MEDVRIYDFEFNLLHTEHDISSCNWSLYDNAIGTFEMHFSLESALTKIVAENRYLVAVQGEKQAIITGRQFGKEGVLYGRSCNWILTRFCVCEEFDLNDLFDSGRISSKDAQTVCSYLIRQGMGDIENFIFEENATSEFGEVFLQNQRVTTVFELVQQSMKQAGGGHRVYFDIKEKQWKFSLVQGKELPVILSEDNRNAYESEYMADLQNLFVGGYYEQTMTDKGDWDIYNNSPWLVNGQASNYATGYKVCLDKELTGHSQLKQFGITFYDGDYIVCTTADGKWQKASELKNFTEQLNPTLSGIYGWKTPLDGSNKTEAAHSLGKYQESSRITLKAKDFRFGRDYQLGDRVIQKLTKGQFTTSANRKITGVNLWYEVSDVGEQPIFEEELN